MTFAEYLGVGFVDLICLLIIRKFVLWLRHSTRYLKIADAVYREKALEVGLDNHPYHNYDHSLMLCGQPIHVVDESSAFALEHFQADGAELQPLGGTIYYLCSFRKTNPFDERPSTLIDIKYHSRSVGPKFFHLLSGENMKLFRKKKVNFGEIYVVGVTRGGNNSLSAKVYLTPRTVEPPQIEIDRRQNARSLLSKIFL